MHAPAFALNIYLWLTRIRKVMVFVFTFAVGGGSGRVVSMPNWALVSALFFDQQESDPFAQNPVGNPDYCERLT